MKKEDLEKRNTRFDNIYRKYYKYLYKIAYDIIDDVREMGDVMQEISFRILLALDKIDSDSEKFVLAAIARNTAINLRKSKGVYYERNICVEDVIINDSFSLSEQDPVDVMINDERLRNLYSKINALDKKYSELLILMCETDCSCDDIAKKLGLKLKTVYTRLGRARQRLSESLELENDGF